MQLLVTLQNSSTPKTWRHGSKNGSKRPPMSPCKRPSQRREDTDWAVDAALVKSLHDAYIAVTQSWIRSFSHKNQCCYCVNWGCNNDLHRFARFGLRGQIRLREATLRSSSGSCFVLGPRTVLGDSLCRHVQKFIIGARPSSAIRYRRHHRPRSASDIYEMVLRDHRSQDLGAPCRHCEHGRWRSDAAFAIYKDEWRPASCDFRRGDSGCPSYSIHQRPK